MFWTFAIVGEGKGCAIKKLKIGVAFCSAISIIISMFFCFFFGGGILRFFWAAHSKYLRGRYSSCGSRVELHNFNLIMARYLIPWFHIFRYLKIRKIKLRDFYIFNIYLEDESISMHNDPDIFKNIRILLFRKYQDFFLNFF